MSRLKELLKEVQEEKTLRRVLKEKYDETPDDIKQSMLLELGNELDRGIDKMIMEEVDNYNSSKPEKKMSRKTLIIVAILNVVMTTLISIAVNMELWGFVTGLGVAYAIITLIPIIQSDN